MKFVEPWTLSLESLLLLLRQNCAILLEIPGITDYCSDIQLKYVHPWKATSNLKKPLSIVINIINNFYVLVIKFGQNYFNICMNAKFIRTFHLK